MKVLFVSPGWPKGRLWGELGFKFPSLSLAALAAVTPTEWEIALWDENIEPAMPATDADLVAITAMTPPGAPRLQPGRPLPGRRENRGHGGLPCQQPA